MINRFFLAFGVALLLSMPARADFSYSLAFTSDGSTPSDFMAVTGSSVIVPVYLVETGTQGAGPAGLDTLNLFGSTSSLTVSNSIATPTSLTQGPDLNAALTSLSGAGPFTLEVGEFLGSPGAAATSFVGGRSVKIGDLTFSTGLSAGSTDITLGLGAGGTFNYSLRTPSVVVGGTSVNGNASSFQTATIVTSVPEPGSLAVLSICAAGVVLRRRRS
ncbi:MAG TPA: hypothetical protein DDW52_14005 [Planctomycetaceae bacterium]|nr:hypothetical protein [Planctomycetaceae bacterium]